MIKGEEEFIQAIKNVRAKGAIRPELLYVLAMQYKKNPDPPSATFPPASQYLEDKPIMKETHNFVIDPLSMKGAEDQFPGEDFPAWAGPIASPEQIKAIDELYKSNPNLRNAPVPPPSFYDGRGIVDGFDPAAPWIQTYSGRRFNPLNPNPEAIVIQDIAHALSMQCRFSGHCQKFYSVAQHCVLVSWICNHDDNLWGLLHDASEAYLVDVPRPIKRSGKFQAYLDFEDTMQKAICKRFNLPEKEPPSVKRADTILLATEARDLMSPLHKDWRQPAPELPFRIESWNPEEAKARFLERFENIISAINVSRR